MITLQLKPREALTRGARYILSKPFTWWTAPAAPIMGSHHQVMSLDCVLPKQGKIMAENGRTKIDSERRWLIIISGISGFILFILITLMIEVLKAPECFTSNDLILPIVFIIFTPIIAISSWIFFWSEKRGLSKLFLIILSLLSLGSCFVMFLLAGGFVYCLPI